MTKPSFAEKARLQEGGIHVVLKLKSSAQLPLKKSELAVPSALAMAAYIHLLLMVLIRIHLFTISDGY